VDLCQNKSLTNRMLRTVGVPVPQGEVVCSADGAWATAQARGPSVVVKPEAGNRGKGVSVDLRCEADSRAAFELADEVHPSNARLAKLAAQILGMDVAGVDVVCTDIRRPAGAGRSRCRSECCARLAHAPGARIRTPARRRQPHCRHALSRPGSVTHPDRGGQQFDLRDRRPRLPAAEPSSA
jgi:hypothetical protein